MKLIDRRDLSAATFQEASTSVSKRPARHEHIKSLHPNHLAAFTLIELLGSILIVAILAVILITSSGTVKQTLNRTKCVSNLRQIGVALIQYSADHNGVLPYQQGQKMHNTPLILVRELVGIKGAAGYLPWDGNGATPLWSEVFMCPGDPNASLYRAAHGTSSVPGSYLYRQNQNGGDSGEPIRLVAKPEAQTGYRRWIVRDRYTQGLAGLTKPFPGKSQDIASDTIKWQPDRVSSSSYWHNNGSNVLLEDGSAQWRPFGETISF